MEPNGGLDDFFFKSFTFKDYPTTLAITKSTKLRYFSLF